jgi:SAM-dependent methyltransferase
MDETAKPNFFRRMDESEDEEFYRWPRRVVHIDDRAIATIGEIYANRIKPGSEILDLMSSWRSHLPAAMRPARVTGLGLNAEEMRDNPALTEVVVHNVNREPRMPFPDQSFDAVVMAVSVQYLTRPIEIFSDVGRVLRLGGPFIVTFSNRMFPTKAVALWQASTTEQRVEVVKRYFAQCDAFERIEAIDNSQREGEPFDPVWAVLGYASEAR